MEENSTIQIATEEGSANYLQVEGDFTTTDGTLFTTPEYIDKEIISYEVSENKKNIVITVKQVLNQFMNNGTYITVYPSYYDQERVLRRTYKVKNGKLKLHKEEVGRIVPPQSLPERYEFD